MSEFAHLLSVAQCVNVPGSAVNCNTRGLRAKIWGAGLRNPQCLAVRSLQETPDAVARHRRGHYGMIVAQEQNRSFTRASTWPTGSTGRFDMLLLHFWLMLRRLRSAEGGEALSQALSHFCVDLDDNLREMGVGDLTVPERRQAFGEAFYGRAAAYALS